ncbi:MAG: serine/threonine-protein kinase [Acidiferrobacterales bacterium]
MPKTNNNTLPTGYELGDYTIESVLGQGGFGITYLANDRQLGTRVAIKEYFPNAFAIRDDEWGIRCRSDIDDSARKTYAWGLKQFLKEARALGQFKHYNIVRVLRFFEANNTAYMVMEYESGQSLARQLTMRGNHLGQPALLRVFVPILNGLQAVHVANLLHRDIKPGNIYLRADESPMLIDFGSVRPTTQDSENIQPVTLTPSYAAVEQYPGQGQEGPWTDIYSIGASMYRCITGAQPVGSFKRYDAIRTYKPDPLTPLLEIRPDGYSDFVLKCVDWAMQIYPQDRPQSARELQDGLMGKRKANTVAPPEPTPPPPVQNKDEFRAERPTRIDRWKIIRWITVGLTAIAALAVYLAYPTGDKQAQIADENENAAAETTTITPLPGIASGAFTAVRQLTGSLGAVEAVVFVPHTNTLLSATRGGELVVWEIDSGKPIASLDRHRHTVRSLVALGHKSLIAAGDDGGNIFIWDPIRKRVIDRLTGHNGAVKALAASPGHKWLASGGRDGRVIIWDLGAQGHSRVLASNLGRIDALSVSPDGRKIAAGTIRGDVYVINTGTGRTLWKLKELGGLVKSTAFSPNGRWLAAAGLGDSIVVWSASDGAMIRKLVPQRPSAVNTLRFSHDGRWLFSGDTRGMVSVWDVSKGTLANSGYRHEGLVSDLALTPDGKTLVSASSDKTLILWAVN